MRVLLGYESSGVGREAFRALGHDAYSCDLLDAADGSPYHIKGNIFDCAYDDWDLGIFHPSCTFLTNSAAWAFTDGPYHMKVKPGTLVGAARRTAREQALSEVRRLMALPYPHAIENPRGFISTMIGRRRKQSSRTTSATTRARRHAYGCIVCRCWCRRGAWPAAWSMASRDGQTRLTAARTAYRLRPIGGASAARPIRE